MPQDGPKIVPRSLLAALGRSWTALGPLFGRSWPLLAALGSLLVRLEPLPADLGASWGDLGAVLKTLGAMRVKFIDFMTPSSSGLMVSPLENPACSGGIACGEPRRGAAVITRGAAPPRDFLRKFLRDLRENSTCSTRDVHKGFSTRRGCAGGGGLKSASRDHRRHPLCSTVLKVLSVFVRTGAGDHCG